MKRIEIIANRSVQEDMFDIFKKRGLFKQYTLLPIVHGSGSSSPKQGDATWPEENFIFLCYCPNEEVPAFAESLKELKSFFPDEGIKMFVMDAEAVI
jgi:hypothetical protein